MIMIMCVLERACWCRCRCRVPLQGVAQGAAVRVVCVLWSSGAGCCCRVLLQGAAVIRCRVPLQGVAAGMLLQGVKGNTENQYTCMGVLINQPPEPIQTPLMYLEAPDSPSVILRKSFGSKNVAAPASKLRWGQVWKSSN